MFFVAAKLLGFFVYPSNAAMLPALAGVALGLTARWARLGRRLATAGVLALALLGLSPLGNLLALTLEERFPRLQLGDIAPPDGIIVLGGAIDTRISTARGAPALNDAAERMTATAALARAFPAARIVFSGGSGNLAAMVWTETTESAVARALFLDFGIAADRLVFEDRSRDTCENALFTREIVAPKPGQRWLLVTSAMHMPRSMALFRKAGFDVTAFPVDFRTGGWGDALRFSYLSNEGLERSDFAVREWVGLLVYWLRGRIDTPLPSP